MKRVLSTLFVLFFVRFLHAQTFSGIVTNEENIPLKFVNVALFSLPDSVLITGTVTNEEGAFSFNQIGNNSMEMFLQFSFIGYKTQIVEVKEQQNIVMENDSLLLGEFVTKGVQPMIRLRNDALVTTIQNSVLSRVGTGNDVLKRLPLLTGDSGIFSVFGKGNAKIYINNREMRDASELDNLNSSDIKEVEIITNPGARYDASVKAVIRITMVRRSGDGLSFDLRSSFYHSQYSDLREQIDVNWRKKGWDLFGSIYYANNEWMKDSKLRQTTWVDTLWTQKNSLLITETDKTLRGIGGVNYEISSKQYMGIKYTLSVFPTTKMLSTLNSTVLANGDFYDKWSSIGVQNRRDRPSHQLNAYYNGTFGDLNVDFNTDIFTNRRRSFWVINETSQEFDDRIVDSESTISNRLIASKLILSYPVLGGALMLGNENTDTYREDQYQNGENIVPSSSTTIKERNNSFFIEYSRPISIGRFSAGIRYENVYSDYMSDWKKIDGQSQKDAHWFPSLSLSTSLKGVNLQASYSAKTQRPTYRELSSNVFYANRFLLEKGNPYLKPSVIHDITLVSTWKFVQFMASYKKEKDVVINWAEQMDVSPAISVISHRNLRDLPRFSAFLIFSPSFSIWSPQLSGGILKQWLAITSNDRSITLDKPVPLATFNNSFSFPKEFILTLDANYQGKGNYQNAYLTKHRLRVNIGLAKSFLDEKLRVELKGHDIFKGHKDGNLFYNSRMELYQFNLYDSREIELTVRYKFNSAGSKYKGTGAGSAEMNRL